MSTALIQRGQGKPRAEAPRADGLPIPAHASGRDPKAGHDGLGRFAPNNQEGAQPKSTLDRMAIELPTGEPAAVRTKIDRAARNWRRRRARDLLLLFGSLGPGPRRLLAMSGAAGGDAVWLRYLARRESSSAAEAKLVSQAALLDEKARAHETFALAMAKQEAEARGDEETADLRRRQQEFQRRMAEGQKNGGAQ